ncbi:MAG: hypothetical protein RQ754_16700 [Desulfuromonadales bacterium]|nr:hypothetical protein [Desulfuromonadales bacterium]
MVIVEAIRKFVCDNDLYGLYRSYSWGGDQWESGFLDILKLETQLSNHDHSSGISLDDVKAVANWGKLRNPGRICGVSPVLPQKSCSNAITNRLEPLNVLKISIIKGIGSTYFTKILRFAAPAIYGALDTRCVRAFGKGDPISQHHDWLDLTVKNYGYGWFIPEAQKNWPAGYGQWLEILDTFCSILPANCPHPESFVRHGMRNKGVWTCADVEMALFAYASNAVK